MREIGVVTWYKNGNYGGTLQAFALMKMLQNHNYSVEFINYDSKSVFVRMIRNVAFHILYPQSALSRDRIYRMVERCFNQSPHFHQIKELEQYSQKYDAVICGSDQIWSSLKGVDPVYFLQFVPKSKRIAYAPSIGVPQILPEYIDDFVKYVKSIPSLSLREKQGVDYVKMVAGIDANLVLDPTFLLNGDEWRELSSDHVLVRNGIMSQGYILCYFLGDDDKYRAYVNDLREKTELPVYYVSFKRKNYGSEQLICDPFEFIGLINNAAYVITDSFHGLALSINLGVKVGVFERFAHNDVKNQNGRVYNLLSLINSHNLMIYPHEFSERLIDQTICFDEIQDAIQTLRQNSIDYLVKSIESQG